MAFFYLFKNCGLPKFQNGGQQFSKWWPTNIAKWWPTNISKWWPTNILKWWPDNISNWWPTKHFKIVTD